MENTEVRNGLQSIRQVACNLKSSANRMNHTGTVLFCELIGKNILVSHYHQQQMNFNLCSYSG
jgi:hypothetical protein